MLTYMHLNVDQCCKSSNKPAERFKFQIVLNYNNIKDLIWTLFSKSVGVALKLAGAAWVPLITYYTTHL